MRTLVFSLLLACCVAAFADTITGRVLGPDGQPVATAKVLILTRQGPQLVESGADGRFTKEIDLSGVPERYRSNIMLAAYKPGFAPAQAEKQGAEFILKLSEAYTATGMLVDDTGAQLADVSVSLQGIILDKESRKYIYTLPFAKEFFTVRSDANGHFTFHDVTKQGQLVIAISDPRFVQDMLTLNIAPADKPEKPLVLHHAGSISGRLLTPDKQPAAGVKLTTFAQIQQSNATLEVISGADGAVLLGGLRAGSYLLKVEDPGAHWVLPPLCEVTVKAKETTALGDLVLAAGGIIDGTVTDFETGKPLPGIALYCESPQEQGVSFAGHRVEADKDGKFRFCLQPGKQFLRLAIPVDGYTRRTQDTETLTLKAGETTTVNFRMSKGLTVSGVLVDEAGKPAAKAVVELHILCGQCGVEGCYNDVTTRITSGADGSFTNTGVTLGKAIFTLPDRGEPDMPAEWDVVKQDPITLPAAAPLRVVLKHVTLCALTGKVVDRKQQPVAGAQVQCNVLITRNGAGNINTVTGVTDATGAYHIEKLRPDVKLSLTGVTKDGYKLVSVGEVTAANGQFTATDTLVTACTGTVAGTVTGAEGKPLAGAIVVSLEGGGEQRVKSDAQGAFTLSAQPEGDITVLAVTPTGAGLWHGSTGDRQATLQVEPAHQAASHDTEMFQQLWASWKTLPKDQRERTIQAIAATDPDTAFKLASEGTFASDMRGYMISDLARTNPAKAAELGPVQLALLTGERERFYTAIDLGVAVVKDFPEVAERCYTIAKDLVTPTQNPVMQHDRYSRLILLAARLKHDDAVKEIFPRLLSATKEIYNGQQLPDLAATLAEFDPKLAAQVWDGLEAGPRENAIARAVGQIARYDAAAALELFTQLPKSSSSYSEALYNLAPVLAKSDPDKALTLTEDQPYVREQVLLAIAETQPKDKALATYRDIFQHKLQQGYNLDDLARLTLKVSQLDPQTGQEFYTQFHQKLEPQWWRNVQYLPYIAMLFNRFDPAEGRITLEVAYAEQRTKGADPGEQWKLQNCARAMTILDIDRTLELLQEFTAKPDTANSLRGFIAAYILATDAQRLKMDRNY